MYKNYVFFRALCSTTVFQRFFLMKTTDFGGKFSKKIRKPPIFSMKNTDFVIYNIIAMIIICHFLGGGVVFRKKKLPRGGGVFRRDDFIEGERRKWMQ